MPPTDKTVTEASYDLVSAAENLYAAMSEEPDSRYDTIGEETAARFNDLANDDDVTERALHCAAMILEKWKRRRG